jgi:diaminohydroxyphosphoribosylaminopyrimidine deaminase/5-amino-6-(5-phosphoribosylamino)uracil reductase
MFLFGVFAPPGVPPGVFTQKDAASSRRRYIFACCQNPQILQDHIPYMQRCLHLAGLGAGHVAPNPLVGAVLVYEGRIIGEGWHRMYGGPHAEINCLDSVPDEDRHLIPHATLYVSLEPCTHFGKTPPCSQRIIQERIPDVVIAHRDPFPDVNGKGIEQLQSASVRVITGILGKEAAHINRRFFTRHTLHRPYIILKWAETADGKIAGPGGQRLYISGDVTNRLVHRWRSEEAAIMVGSQTILADDPMLTNRFWTGAQPVRIVTDRQLRLSHDRQVFNEHAPTIILNTIVEKTEGNIQYLRIQEGDDLEPVLTMLSEKGIQSILVEGGTALISSFMRQGYWDEIRRVVSATVLAPGGIDAPAMREIAVDAGCKGNAKEGNFDMRGNISEKNGKHAGRGDGYLLEKVEHLLNDRIEYYVKAG